MQYLNLIYGIDNTFLNKWRFFIKSKSTKKSYHDVQRETEILEESIFFLEKFVI